MQGLTQQVMLAELSSLCRVQGAGIAVLTGNNECSRICCIQRLVMRSATGLYRGWVQHVMLAGDVKLSRLC